jgi:hypothetical protein
MIPKADGSLVAFPGASGNGPLLHRSPEDVRRELTQRSPVKLEQVTPPTTPGKNKTQVDIGIRSAGKLEQVRIDHRYSRSRLPASQVSIIAIF